MQQADHDARQRRAQRLVGRRGIGQVQCLAFLDQRADPVNLAPLRHLGSDAFRHLVAPAVRNQLGDDGRSPRRQLVDGGNVQVRVVAHRQRARDRRGRHHQQMRFLPGLLHLCPQRQPLGDAETMLLIDDGQAQIPELDLLLDHGVRADHQRCLAAGDQREHLGAFLLFLAAGQPRHPQAPGREQRLEPADQLAEMLLRQDLGGRHQRALPSGVDGDGRRERRHHGLARADIALQQPVHGNRAPQVAGDLLAHALLGRRQLEWQRRQQLLVQALRLGREGGRAQGRAFAFALQLRKLLRKQFFRLQPLPGRVAAIFQRGHRHIRRGVVQERQRFAQAPHQRA